MSGPRGFDQMWTGEPAAKLPTHILVTDELVSRAVQAFQGGDGPPFARMRDALSAVAPDLFAAGMRAGARLTGIEEEDRETEEERDTTREVGAGSGYWIAPDGTVRSEEEQA